jgi:hypothetical protein
MDSNSENIVFGVAWYSEKEWYDIREIASDRGIWEFSYEEWLHSAKEKLSVLESTGNEFKKVDVIASEFIEWNMKTGKKVTGGQVALFVAHKLKEQDN